MRERDAWERQRKRPVEMLRRDPGGWTEALEKRIPRFSDLFSDPGLGIGDQKGGSSRRLLQFPRSRPGGPEL